MTVFLKSAWSLIICLLLLAGCGGLKPLGETFRKSPHDKYAESLHTAQLDNTALGRAWLEAGQRALSDSLMIRLPYKETGYFPAEQAKAISYRLLAQRGEVLTILLEKKSSQPVRLFADVFEREKGTDNQLKLKLVASSDSTGRALAYEVKHDGMHLIRLQPELLCSVQYTITIQNRPSLSFPVQGKGNQAVGSFYGSDRDGGRRLHEGVDIFAHKGTPVLAVSKGTISSVNENQLGGRVVWQEDEKRRILLYYAHLDKQLVSAGQEVKPGDTLGLVGNTGNAKYTPSHLHFGIYTGRGTIDPYPFIRQSIGQPRAINTDLSRLGNWARNGGKQSTIRLSPDSKSLVLAEVPRYTPMRVIAATHDWYRIALPDGMIGYVAGSTLESLEKPIKEQKLVTTAALLDSPNFRAAPVDSLKPGAKVSILASFGYFQYVKDGQGRSGWLVNE
jgi:murein DD-endopeptidase MepM/ murein hydrolase activator NlpD